MKTEYQVRGLQYCIRPAREADAEALSQLRLQVDSETENLDREPGEGVLDEAAFAALIQADAAHPRNLLVVAEVNGRLAGFARCQGTDLQRLAHKVEFGIGVLREFWGYGMGKALLQTCIAWADASGIRKMSLSVLETNEAAIQLYKKLGFEVEGVLKKDKRLSDGNYYHTIMMGRWRD